MREIKNSQKDIFRKALKEEFKISDENIERMLHNYGQKYKLDVDRWMEKNINKSIEYTREFIKKTNGAEPKGYKPRGEKKKVVLRKETEPFVVCLCMVKDSHARLEESIRQFVEQTYIGKVAFVIYNYGKYPKEVNTTTSNKGPVRETYYKENQYVIVINNNERTDTGEPYEENEPYEEILCDALSFVHELIPQTKVITFWNDHDTYLKKHVESGVEGWVEARKIYKKIYQPQMSILKVKENYTYTPYIGENSAFISSYYLYNNFKKWKDDKLILIQSKKPTYVKNLNERIPDYSGGILIGTPAFISNNETNKIELWIRTNNIENNKSGDFNIKK